MKKLLLAGIMILSASAFAAIDAKEAAVDIKAKVVQPLDIKTTPLDYGMLIPGQTKWGNSDGKIDITGTAGENIKLMVKESEEAGYVSHEGPEKVYNVTLTTGSGELLEEKLPTELTLFIPGVLTSTKDGIYQLEQDGKKTFSVNGWAKSRTNQKSGEYKGRLYVKAMYQ